MSVTPLPAGEQPRVDIGALSGSLFSDATGVVAQTIVLAMDWLEEDGRGLNEAQKLQLIKVGLLSVAGLEHRFQDELKETLQRAGVATWGENFDA